MVPITFWRWTSCGQCWSPTLEHPFGMQVGDRGFSDFLSRRFTDNAETEQTRDEMCDQIEGVPTRAQDPGAARPDIVLADIVKSHLGDRPDHRRHRRHRPGCLATQPPPHARRIPGRAGTPHSRAADDVGPAPRHDVRARSV